MTGADENCKEEIPLTVIRTLHVELPSFYTFRRDDDTHGSKHVAF